MVFLNDFFRIFIFFVIICESASCTNRIHKMGGLLHPDPYTNEVNADPDRNEVNADPESVFNNAEVYA